MNPPLLDIVGLEAGYGEQQVLYGIDLSVGVGEVVSLMGRNGMGKTTTVRALMGLLPIGAGRIRFEGRPIAGEPPFRIAQAGIGLVPEGRQIFPTLTVEENLDGHIRHPQRRGAARLDAGARLRLPAAACRAP